MRNTLFGVDNGDRFCFVITALYTKTPWINFAGSLLSYPQETIESKYLRGLAFTFRTPESHSQIIKHAASVTY